MGFSTRVGDLGGNLPNNNDSLNFLERRVVVLTIPADTWTQVPKSDLGRIIYWEALDGITSENITESFEYRRVSGELEVKSTILIENVQFIIYGDFIDA